MERFIAPIVWWIIIFYLYETIYHKEWFCEAISRLPTEQRIAVTHIFRLYRLMDVVCFFYLVEIIAPLKYNTLRLCEDGPILKCNLSYQKLIQVQKQN